MNDRHRGRLAPDSPIEPGAAEMRPLPPDPLPLPPDGWQQYWPDDFPFPLAESKPPPVMVSRPCGCTSMDIGEGDPPAQISWCNEHDPGYEP